MITGGLLAVIVVLFVIVFLNLEGIVNRNKDFFLSQAESALGREVSVEKIGITLRGGIGVRLENVTIADDPTFSSEPFVRAKDLQINAKLLPLLKKQFEIKRVILRDPVIQILRDADGNRRIADQHRWWRAPFG
jgi:AsmA protein